MAQVNQAGFSLVLGGARSGKSRHAEAMLTVHPAPWIYLATARTGDAEMERRVALHRGRRGPEWETREAERDLVPVLDETGGRPLLLDCVTMWVANLLMAGMDVAPRAAELAASLAARPAPAVVVSGEVGLGIVPENTLARAFRDALGETNQTLAAAARSVTLVVAGIPMQVR